MKNKSIGFVFSMITCALSVIILIMLLMYSARGGTVRPVVYAALVVSVICEASALAGEKRWSDFASILGTAALAYVLMTVLSDGIWNIAESLSGIKMVGIPELAGMNYALAGVNGAAMITAIIASFLKKSK